MAKRLEGFQRTKRACPICGDVVEGRMVAIAGKSTRWIPFPHVALCGQDCAGDDLQTSPTAHRATSCGHELCQGGHRPGGSFGRIAREKEEAADLARRFERILDL